jgi:protein-arginine kinase activator protein McsA
MKKILDYLNFEVFEVDEDDFVNKVNQDKSSHFIQHKDRKQISCYVSVEYEADEEKLKKVIENYDYEKGIWKW